MRKAISAVSVMMGLALFTGAESLPTASSELSPASINANKLGPHMSGGRGCSGCHTPHSASVGLDQADDDPDSLWSLKVGPLYGTDSADADEDAPSPDDLIPQTAVDAQVRGIMMCLSCHDGQTAKGAMVTAASYEGLLGLLPESASMYAIAPLVSSVGGAAPAYIRAHPVGTRATLGSLGLDSHVQLKAGGCVEGGVAVPCLEVRPDAYAYRSFVDAYGSPSITFRRSNPVGIPYGASDASQAFVMCTTCHTPHTMHGFTASDAAPIAKRTSGVFPSHFFIAAPYNPEVSISINEASSATQFCRQCHFSDIGANEEVGIATVKTKF